MLVKINRNVQTRCRRVPCQRQPHGAAGRSPTAARPLLTAAERLIAEHGFLAVRLEDIGAAAGVSGPAIYRHFPNKEALLVELLVGISTRLLAGAQAVVADAADPAAALDGLIEFHLDFALGESDLIRIQDRDLDNCPPPAQAPGAPRAAQYVEIWVTCCATSTRSSTSPTRA